MHAHARSTATRRMSAIACAFVAAAVCGCAVSPPPDGPIASQPIARMSLRPEYRVFHDALVDQGEWILIEPFGFVFRPKVNFESWRPYNDGFWVPTDFYGWVWVSTEPFGWATYHYGNWLYDAYQGWVWVPGIDWGPSWVTWSTSGVYVGWTPLGPRGMQVAQTPVDATSWAPASAMGSTDLKSHVQTTSALGAELRDVRPANNAATIEGVVVNTGPSVEWVERQGAGPLRLATLDDLVPTNAPLVGGDRKLDGLKPRGGTPGDTPGAKAADGNERMPVAIAAQRAAERAAREARLAQKAGALVRLPVVRPFGVPMARGAAPVRSDSDTLR